jgi:hypothetical protein
MQQYVNELDKLNVWGVTELPCSWGKEIPEPGPVDLGNLKNWDSKILS